MARILYEDSKEFEVSNSFDAFTLVDDNDSDKVQFLLGSLNDVLIYSTHNVPAVSKNGKRYDKKISCLKLHKNDPQGVCPLCDSGNRLSLTRFVPLYSLSQEKMLLWERGPQFISHNLAGLINRMIAEGKDPRNVVVDVVRSGRKGDTKTTYQFYPLEHESPVSLEDIEIPDPEGSWIATWSAAEMQQYVATGAMPINDAGDSQVQRRERTAATSQAPVISAPLPYSNPPAAPYNTAEAVQVADPSDAF